MAAVTAMKAMAETAVAVAVAVMPGMAAARRRRRQRLRRWQRRRQRCREWDGDLDDGFGADIPMSGKAANQHQPSFTQAPVDQDTLDDPNVLSLAMMQVLETIPRRHHSHPNMNCGLRRSNVQVATGCIGGN
eukprot:6194700-Pleurochrysis_carterae.AAC.1